MIGKILLVILVIMGNFSVLGYSSDNPKKKRILVLDAGHGGKDSGATGQKAKEKDIVLAITLKVGNYVEQNLPDVQVIYTRKTDVFPPLDKRAEIANKNNADLFISIHANSNKSNKPIGTETYAMGLSKTQGNFEVAQKENSVILLEEDYHTRYEGFDPNSSESYIIFSMMQNTYLDKSLTMASYVQDEFREKAKRIDRGVKQAGFLVLWNTSMPSILVEVGFVSHPKEEEFLLSETGQDYLASSIYRAIKKYFMYFDMEELELAPSDELRNKLTDNPNDSNINTPDKSNTVIISDVVFRVQITSSTKKLEFDHPIFIGYSDIYEYKENNMYKYTIGQSAKYEEIKTELQKIKVKFPGAFIVAFKNNNRIDLKQVIDQ
jgi:N-acetylmuramoyl-L-alanine amidase